MYMYMNTHIRKHGAIPICVYTYMYIYTASTPEAHSEWPPRLARAQGDAEAGAQWRDMSQGPNSSCFKGDMVKG